MHFGNLVKAITKTLNISREKLFYDLIKNYPKAEKEYKEMGNEMEPFSEPLTEFNVERDINKFHSYCSKDREAPVNDAQAFYISFLYYLNNMNRIEDIESTRQIFENINENKEEKIKFVGNNIKMNFHHLLKEAFPNYYNANDEAIFNNATLDAEQISMTSSIPDRIIYPESTKFYSVFERFKLDGVENLIPYKEIYGIWQGVAFYEDKNIRMKYLPCDAFDENDIECRNCPQKKHIKEYLLENSVYTGEEFEEEVEKKRHDALRRNYNHHPAKLKITRFQRVEMNPDQNQYQLMLEFGCSGYLEHLVYQDVLDRNTQIRDDFFKDIESLPESISFNERNTVWSRAGGGIWIVTNDNYLIVSYRGKTVHEVPQLISYSSSGGFDRKIWNKQSGKYEEGTPIKNMKREILQELNIDAESEMEEEPELISFGVDLLGGPWMQFSFFARCVLNRDEIIERRPRAIDNHEFKVFFIPFTADAVKALLLKARFEAGAEYSLYEIYNEKLA